MENKISTQFAFGIILLLAILVGGIFVIQDKRISLEEQYYQQSRKKEVQIKVSTVNSEKKNESAKISCKERYYEGEADVRVWLISSDNDGQKLKVRIKNEDIEKLPTTKADSQSANFVATLIDPTSEIKENLENSSQENPVSLTVHGYAQVCQDSPLVSIEQATVAFKKG